MKKIKKIMAMLLAMVMVLGMTVTAMASGGLPTLDDRGSVTIKNVAMGDQVSIYKIVKANYNDKGFYGYEEVVKNSIEDLTAPTTEEIAALAKNQTLQESANAVASSTEVRFDDLAIGMYLVKIAANDPFTVYNPMIVSVHYSTADNDQILDGEVDANTNWVINGETAYAKSSTNNTPEKNIVDDNGKVIVNGDVAGKGDAVAKGDTVNYKISGTVPSYSREYFDNPTYVIKDTLSSGLDFAADTQSTVQRQVDAKYGENKATVTVEGRVLTITFTPECIWDIADSENERKFEFTYSAVLNGTSVNFDPSTNSVEVEYSKTPEENTNSTPVNTYNYTFAFNGEIQKIDEKGIILPGATFGLFSDPECKKPANYGDGTSIPVLLSDDKGEFAFTGLDDDTIYYLKETKAPDGYQLNNTVYGIKFEAKYAEDGKLTEYTVSVQDITNQGEIKTTTYGPGEGNVSIVVGEKNITQIKNTKLSSLPSTGGIGTTIFTIGGCAIMVAAAGLFFASRRKANK